MELTAKEKGLTFSLINGIEKIRLSGAENRVFSKWMDLYTMVADLKFNPPMIIRLNAVFTTAITLTGTIVMYYVAVKSGVSVADYYAFNSAYAYISAAFTAISSVALTAATVRPSLEIIRPLLDEATSALDNITQKQVSEALDKMRCTRIVIAHRLSTIRNCDRILVMDGGKIAEDGTYDELIAKNGLFAELVERQRLDA